MQYIKSRAKVSAREAKNLVSDGRSEQSFANSSSRAGSLKSFASKKKEDNYF